MIVKVHGEKMVQAYALRQYEKVLAEMRQDGIPLLDDCPGKYYLKIDLIAARAGMTGDELIQLYLYTRAGSKVEAERTLIAVMALQAQRELIS